MGSISYSALEILGYLSMFVALSFIFFGIKSYRDKVNNRTISFGKAFGLGILIALIPAFLFGVFDALYVAFVNPEFFDQYMAATIAEMPATVTSEELAAKIAEMEQMKELGQNPLFNFALMFLTVMILGFIISLLSAIVLKKSPKVEIQG